MQELFFTLIEGRENKAFEALEIPFIRIRSSGIWRTWKFNQVNKSFTTAMGGISRGILIIKDRVIYVKFRFLSLALGSGIISEKNDELGFALYNNIYNSNITLSSQHLFGVILCQALY